MRFCDGCWEILPCKCGTGGMCYDCANIPMVAETVEGNIENDFNEGLAMVYAEVQRMNQSFIQVLTFYCLGGPHVSLSHEE